MGMNREGPNNERRRFAPLEPHEEKAPFFPMFMSTLRPHLFRIGCVFCADIVVLRNLYRPYRRHRFISRPPDLARASFPVVRNARGSRTALLDALWDRELPGRS